MGILQHRIMKMMATIVTVLFVFSSIGRTATIPVNINVGDVDEFVGWCSGTPSGDPYEISCLNDKGAGLSLVLGDTAKAEGDDLNPVLVDGTSNTYAQALPTGFTGEYFLLKTGNLTPGPGSPTIVFYIFKNLAEAAYAVVDLDGVSNDEFPDGYPYPFDNVGQISHFTGIKSVTLVTPLPAAAWMMISALGGMFGFKRFSLWRRKQA